MAVPGPTPNPWYRESGGDYLGRNTWISVTWNPATRAMTGATVHKDPGGKYDHVYVGLGPDGTPNSSTRVLGPIPDGDTVFNAQQVSKIGSTIDDLTSVNFTFGD